MRAHGAAPRSVWDCSRRRCAQCRAQLAVRWRRPALGPQSPQSHLALGLDWTEGWQCDGGSLPLGLGCCKACVTSGHVVSRMSLARRNTAQSGHTPAGTCRRRPGTRTTDAHRISACFPQQVRPHRAWTWTQRCRWTRTRTWIWTYEDCRLVDAHPHVGRWLEWLWGCKTCNVGYTIIYR